MAVVLSVAAGFITGGATAGAIIFALVHSKRCPDPTDHQLRDDEREQVASEFAVHATSVHRELGWYADALADGDANLRERLRHIEAGMST